MGRLLSELKGNGKDPTNKKWVIIAQHAATNTRLPAKIRSV
jgi:hypothetical protein